MKVYLVTRDYVVHEYGGTEGEYDVPVAVYATFEAARQHIDATDDRDGWVWHEYTGDAHDGYQRRWSRVHPDMFWSEQNYIYSIQEWEVQEAPTPPAARPA